MYLYIYTSYLVPVHLLTDSFSSWSIYPFIDSFIHHVFISSLILDHVSLECLRFFWSFLDAGCVQGFCVFKYINLKTRCRKVIHYHLGPISLKSEPSWGLLPTSTPTPVQRMMRRNLRRHATGRPRGGREARSVRCCEVVAAALKGGKDPGGKTIREEWDT